MSQIHQSRSEPIVPPSLDAASSKLVYLALAERGEATISTLASALDMQLLALYSILGSLADENMVERDGETYRLCE
jgi:DNA-binding IclR family transcriptional regulator